jgi:hypothetical protein
LKGKVVFAVCLGKTDAEMSLPFEDGKVFERSNKKRPGVSPGDHSGGKTRQVVGNTMKGLFFFTEEEVENGGSSESDAEEHVEVERQNQVMGETCLIKGLKESSVRKALVELSQGTARVSCVSIAHTGCAAAKGRRETRS